MKGKMKFFGLLLSAVIIAGGIFSACENLIFQDIVNKGSTNNNNNSGVNSDNNSAAVVVWDPVMVIVLKTTDNKIGTLSFAPQGAETASPSLSDGNYNYRLHVSGDIFSMGTVTVSNSGATFAFVSDSGNEFTGRIVDGVFSFNSTVTSDGEEEDQLNFIKAEVPAADGPVIPAESISLSHKYHEGDAYQPISDSFTLDLGGTAVLRAVISPAGADTQVWWSTDKPGVIKIEPTAADGLSVTITAPKGGTAAIKVKTAAGGKTASYLVTVKNTTPGIYDANDNRLVAFSELTTGATPLAKAFAWIKDSGTNNGDYTILLNDSESTTAGYTIDTGVSSTGTTGIKTNLKITLKGMNPETTITKTAADALFNIYDSGTGNGPELVLGGNITLSGYNGNDTTLIFVGNGTTVTNNKGTLTMLEGSRITGNTSSIATCGAGVTVLASGAFTMNGGSIDGNINNCTSVGGGGGVLTSGTFILNDGEIKDNTTQNANCTYGGGVLVNGGSFKMNGGTISGNVARSTNVSANVSYRGIGGGVAVRTTFTMEGGTIENNTADYGGGIATHNTSGSGIVPDVVVTISGGFIQNNRATQIAASNAIDVLRTGQIITINGGTVYGTNAPNINNAPVANNTSEGTGHAIARRIALNSTTITHYCDDTVTALSVSKENVFSAEWTTVP
jgi:hypothetical protein